MRSVGPGVDWEKRNKPDPYESQLNLGEKIVPVQIDKIVVDVSKGAFLAERSDEFDKFLQILFCLFHNKYLRK